MKKITSLMMMLLFVCASAFAQLPELSGFAVQKGDEAATLTPDTQWYLVWNKRVHTTEGGGYFQDMGVNENAIMSAGTGVVQDGMAATDAAKFLVRFISNGNDEQGNPQFYLQFGTGNYMKATSLTANAVVQTVKEVENATSWNVYNINGTEYHFALNIAPMGKRLDENGSGATIATWGDGVLTETGGNNDFTFYAIDLVEASEIDLALAGLAAIYNEYSENHLAPEEEEVGDAYGQYSQEAVEAYTAALEYAENVIDAGADCGLTVEQIVAAGQAIKDAWTALVASRKPFAMFVAPGYYVIKNTVDFSETTTEDDPESGEEVTLTKHLAKAIYEDKGTAKWKTFEPKADFLFKVEATAKTNQYKVTNMLNGLTFDPIKTSTAATMSATDSLVVFDWAANTTVYANELDDEPTKEVTAVNIRLAAQAERGSAYAHAGGHGSGAGKTGNIVGWSTGGATDWYLDPIDETTALAWIEAASPVKAITAMIDSVDVIKTAFPKQLEIAQDIKGFNIINAYSPCDHNTINPSSTDGQGLAALYDNNLNTFWHSAWNNQPQYNHYFVIEASDELNGEFSLVMGRRNSNSDRFSSLNVYGANDFNGEDYDGASWELLGTCAYDASDETRGQYVEPDHKLNTNGVGYRFLKVELNEKTVSSGDYFWHAAEVRIAPTEGATNATTPQSEARAALITALETAIAAWNEAGYTVANVTDPNDPAFVAAYNAVVEAYAAWSAVYADPTPLRQAIKAAEAFTDMIVVGTNPGQWSEGSTGAAIKDIVTDAKAYDNSGTYTPESMAEWIEKVNGAQKNVAGDANQVVPGKWYTIRFSSEEDYEEYGWNKTPAGNDVQGPLFDNYIVPANVESFEGANVYTVPDEVFKGQQLRFMAGQDDSKFRFVEIDGGMALQHMSGWYVGTNGTLTDAPALMSSEAVGYGKSIIKMQQMNGEDIKAGGSPAYMHAQLAGHALVAWAAYAVDSNSALYIENADDAVIDDCQELVQPGQIKFTVSPVGVTYGSDVKLYTFDGYEMIEGGVKVAFTETTKAEAGKAVLMVVAGDYNDKATDEDKIVVDLTLGNELAAIPDSTQALQATYKYQWVEKDDMPHMITIFENKMQVANGEDNTDCARDISAYTGAIDLTLAEAISTEGKDLIIEVLGDVDPTAIEEVVAKAINANGKIYTIDGKYVGNGNIGTARNMGTGIYIINGVKIYVK